MSGVAGGLAPGGGGYAGWDGCAEDESAVGDSGMKASSLASWLPNPKKSASAAAWTDRFFHGLCHILHRAEGISMEAMSKGIEKRDWSKKRLRTSASRTRRTRRDTMTAETRR